MKKILALILAIFMMFGTFVACGDDENDINKDIENEADAEDSAEDNANADKDTDETVTTESGNSEQGEATESSNADVTEDNSKSESVTNNTQDEEDANSLKNYVLTNPAYNDIIRQSSWVNSSNHETAYQLDPHPYAFLASKGHNVQEIKNGTIKCETFAYVLDDDNDSVFMATRVFENGIATHYTIEYELNENDMAFYKKVNSGYYIQAAFANDALSTLYAPINETCVKLFESASNGLNFSLTPSIILGCNYGAAFITGADIEKDTISYVVIPRFNSTTSQDFICKTRIATVQSRGAFKCNNGIYDLPSAGTAFLRFIECTDKDGIFFQIQDYSWMSRDNMNNCQ